MWQQGKRHAQATAQSLTMLPCIAPNVQPKKSKEVRQHIMEAMHFKDTRVGGAWIIDISPHHDDRGRFLRAWCVREFEEQGIHFLPVQANMQFSPRVVKA